MKSRTFLLCIAASLFFHGTVLSWPRLSGCQFPPAKKNLEVALIRLGPPESAPSAQAGRPTAQTHQEQPRKKARMVKAAHSTKQPPIPTVKPAPAATARKPATVQETKPRAIAEPTPTIDPIGQGAPQRPETASTVTLAQFTESTGGPAPATEGKSNHSANQDVTDPSPSSKSEPNPPEIINPPSYHINPPPVYPTMALKRRWQGELWLRALIGEQGEVIDLRLESSSGHALLDDTAIDTVRRWKFHPARDGDKTISQTVRLPIRFELAKANSSL